MPQAFRLRGRPGTPSYSFEVSAPYTEGYELDAAEAAAMNAMRAERIQDRVRGREFARELAAIGEGEVLSDEALERVRAVVAELDATFAFGGGRTKVQYARQSTVEQEARRLAAEALQDSDSQSAVTEARIAALAASPAIQAEAAERVRAKARLAATAMDALLG